MRGAVRASSRLSFLWILIEAAFCFVLTLFVSVMQTGASVVGAKPKTAQVPHKNLPMSELYATSRANTRLHVRRILPPGGVDAIRASCFYFHGFSAHVNRRPTIAWAESLAEQGVAVIMWDQRGHGYSDGMVSYLPAIGEMIDDAEDIFNVATGVTEPGTRFSLDLSSEHRSKLSTVPMFVTGQSMGGAQSILLSQRLHNTAPQFKGAVLLCPALSAELPPPPVIFALKHIVAPLFSTYSMPACLDPTSDPTHTWKSPEHIHEFSVCDDLKTGGLSFKGCMRFGTGLSLLQMTQDIEKILPELNFPFVVLHDPEDKVCAFKGTEALMARSGTSSDQKKLVRMPEMRHDLVCNCTEAVTAEMLAFIAVHT